MNTEKKPENPFVEAAEKEKAEKQAGKESRKPQAEKNDKQGDGGTDKKGNEATDKLRNDQNQENVTRPDDPSRNDAKGERPDVPAY